MKNSAKPIIGLAWLSFLVWGCVEFKPNQLYIDPEAGKPRSFFAASQIYSEALTSEAWQTKTDARCLTMEATPNAAFKGKLGLHIKWNRVREGCPWLGVGFGWDNWTGKNLSRIKNTGAIVFYVRMPEGERAGLPWAVGLEDYAGGQAWLGMNKNVIKADKITTNWTRIEMPLSEFNWDEQQADASNIKQIIFNLEADGEIFLDEIQIEPYFGGYRKRAHITTLRTFDVFLDEEKSVALWKTDTLKIGDDRVHLAIVPGHLAIAGYIKDKTPLQNSKSGMNSYDGDGFEIAFSTDLEARRNRLNYRMSDQHIGFAFGATPHIWNYRRQRPLREASVVTYKTDDGYWFEALIKLEELGMKSFEEQRLYGLELAINKGTDKSRDEQMRWNDPINPGFHENPNLWGEMFILPTDADVKQ
jgi:hypothetical protein